MLYKLLIRLFIKNSMHYLEAIVELKNIVNQNLINKLIPLINKKAQNDLNIVSGHNKNVRNVKGFEFLHKTPTDIFYWNLIKQEIQRLFIYYKSKFPQIECNTINQINVLKYSKGCKFETHTDNYSNFSRHLSVIINLNDEYKGGDLVFTDQKKKEVKRLKLSKGTIVFFPSNFMYPHKIEPITKGIRYSIVAWIQ